MCAAAMTLTADLLTPKSDQFIYEPKHMWPKLGELPFTGFWKFWDYGVQKVFGTHRLATSLTDSRTDTPENSMKVFGRRHKNQSTSRGVLYADTEARVTVAIGRAHSVGWIDL